MATINGTNGNNTLTGGATDDYIYGLLGSDVLNGGAGDDVLTDYALDPGAINILNGGTGNDRIYAGIKSKTDGGIGSDYLDLSYSGQSIYSANITFTAVGQAVGTDGVSFKSIEDFRFSGSNANDSVNGSINTYAMTLYGNGGNDTLRGGLNDDYLYGGTGSDSLAGGGGDDVLSDYALDVNSGVVAVNSFDGGLGNDRIYAGVKSKTDGGTGNDYLDLSYSGQSIYSANITFTAAGQAAGTDGVSFKSIEDFRFSGSNANDSLNGSVNTYAMTLYGNGGNDTLRGGLNADYLYGGTGSDSLAGGGGDDVLSDYALDVNSGVVAVNSFDGGAGNDRIYAGVKSKTDGGTGNDYLDLSYNSQSIYSANISFTGVGQAVGTDGVSFKSIEDFRFSGSNANDSLNGSVNTYAMTLYGNGGNDTLRGGLNADYLYGDAGSDSLAGGGGDDVLSDYALDVNSGVVAVNSFDGGAGNDRIYAGLRSKVDGGSGNDYLDLSYNGQSIYGLNLTFTAAGQAAGTDGTSIKNIEDFRFSGSDANDSVNGGVNTAAMTFYGNGGNDVLRGGLLADYLYGNDGNDVLQGGAGNDYLSGGAGSDRFEFKGGTVAALGVDSINGFEVAVDKIVLSKATFGAVNPALGALSAASFAIVANDAAVGASSAAIVYSQTTGDLFYNSNLAVAGLGTGGRFADLNPGLVLTAANFLVVA
jgi:Ca2+-binding RTX toxin-like protein